MKIDFRTSDLLTISALLLGRHKLLSADRADGKRVVFAFKQTPELENDLAKLESGELTVNAADFWTALN